MKAVLIGALAATAFSADTITYPGTYQVAEKQGTPTTDCCYPNAAGVAVAAGSAAGKYKVTWTFDTTANGCAITDAQNKQFTGEGTLTANAITFTQDLVTGDGATWTLNVPADTNGEYVLDLTKVAAAGKACKAVLGKTPAATPTYTGVYTVGTKGGAAAACCYPAGDVIIRQPTANGAVSLDWSFGANTAAGCPVATLQNDIVSGSATPNTVTGNVDITDANTQKWSLVESSVSSATAPLLDLSGGDNADDCYATLTKKTLPTVDQAGVYSTVQNGADSKCCFPVGDVTVTKDGTQYNLAWTFGEEAGCGTTYKGQKISAKATPDIATKDITITTSLGGATQSWTLDYPATNDGDFTLDLSAIDSTCSVTLDKSGYLVGLGSLVALSLSYIMF